MADDNGKPKLGRSARLLGVRLGIDIDVVEMPRNALDARGYLRPVVERPASGAMVLVALRNTKGMSASTTIESLPAFRRPEAFGGTGRDPLWHIDDSHIGGDLEAVQDSDTHVSIMPRTAMLLENYEMALAETQNYWQKVSNDDVGL